MLCRVRVNVEVRTCCDDWLNSPVEVGRRQGVVTEDGQGVQAFIDDLVARTPGAVEAVQARLPAGFPPRVADAILGSVSAAARSLAGA